MISETGWFDDARFKQDMADYGGSEQTQYRIAWDAENAGGYAALLTITRSTAISAKILLDTGWNNEDGLRVRPPGRRPMLERARSTSWCCRTGTDHFWGIESTLKTTRD